MEAAVDFVVVDLHFRIPTVDELRKLENPKRFIVSCVDSRLPFSSVLTSTTIRSIPMLFSAGCGRNVAVYSRPASLQTTLSLACFASARSVTAAKRELNMRRSRSGIGSSCGGGSAEGGGGGRAQARHPRRLVAARSRPAMGPLPV